MLNEVNRARMSMRGGEKEKAGLTVIYVRPGGFRSGVVVVDHSEDGGVFPVLMSEGDLAEE